MNDFRINAADIAAMNEILNNLKDAEDGTFVSAGTDNSLSIPPVYSRKDDLEIMGRIISKYNQVTTEPVSTRIRNRLETNGARYFAGDNISEHLLDGERDELIAELTAKFTDVLKSLVIDTEKDPNSKETGKRLAKMYVNEIMSGRYDAKPDVTAFPNEGTDHYDGMIVIRADIKSMCSHHHQTVSGTAFIGIVPEGQVLGLSKYIRLAQWEARRGTLQEELTSRIAKRMVEETKSKNVAVYIQAEHGCVSCRGVSQDNSLTQTTVLLGGFKTDKAVREEFYHNVQMQTQYKK